MDSPNDDRDQTATAGPAAQRGARASVGVRWLALFLFAGSSTLLGVAAWLKPDNRGFGTHRQLGAGECGMLESTRYPCPSCGMTTAFAHTVRGQWLRAIWAQPSGFILALATIALGAISAWMMYSGRWPAIDYLAITPYRLFATLLILLLGGWALKIVIGLIDGTLPLERVPR